MESDERQSDIRDVLQYIQQEGKIGLTHRGRMELCMKHFAARHVPISTLATSKYLNRSASTLKAYARDLSLSFPDYTPMKMRVKDG